MPQICKISRIGNMIRADLLYIKIIKSDFGSLYGEYKINLGTLPTQ